MNGFYNSQETGSGFLTKKIAGTGHDPFPRRSAICNVKYDRRKVGVNYPWLNAINPFEVAEIEKAFRD